MPFWVLLLAWFVLGEQVRGLQWISVVAALMGLICMLMPLSFSEGLFSKELAVLSSVAWAGGVIVAKTLHQRSPLDLLSFTTWQMLFGSIPLIVVALLVPSTPIDWSPAFIAAMFYSVIPGNAIAWLLWFYALSRLPAGVAGLGTLAAPVIGVLAARIQLGEQPRALEAVGMVFIIAALGLNAMQALRPQRRA
jgi:drug/metabolite transporter (DMT)-like permease